MGDTLLYQCSFEPVTATIYVERGNVFSRGGGAGVNKYVGEGVSGKE